MPSRCVRITNFIIMCRCYTTYKKTVVILQLVTLGYTFRPLPGHHQACKETVLIKVHSLAFPMGSHCLHWTLGLLKKISALHFITLTFNFL